MWHVYEENPQFYMFVRYRRGNLRIYGGTSKVTRTTAHKPHATVVLTQGCPYERAVHYPKGYRVIVYEPFVYDSPVFICVPNKAVLFDKQRYRVEDHYPFGIMQFAKG